MEKFLLTLRVFVIGLVTLLAAESSACTYTFKLYDSYGDGWNNGTLTILVNGVPVASNITLQSGYGPYIYTITVNHGDSISTIHTPGGWPEENYYDVYDNAGQFVLRDGCDDYSCLPSGGFLTVAVCPETDAAMSKLVSPTIGCGLGAAESFTVLIRNTGINTLDTFLLSYSLTGGTTWVTETLYHTLLPGDTLLYTFSQTADLSMYGSYAGIFVVTANRDENAGNDTLEHTIISLPMISTFPYFEDFETGQGGWYTGGANSSWALGTPNGWTIDSAASGVNAWVTHLTGPYNDNEASYVASPCFDFTGLTYPIFEMKIWYDSYEWYDGAAVEYTTDGVTWHRLGAFNDPVNWYNRDWVEGLGMYFGNYHGWSGYTPGYVTVSRVLPSHLAGVPAVQFRIVFGSTQWHYGGFDGVAFDDVRIYQPPSMSIVAATGFQADTLPVGVGMLNQLIVGVKLETQDPADPLQVTDIRFNTTGTSNPNDIAAARVVYTSDFNTWTIYGQDEHPTGPFGFQDTITLVEGDNYFLLVYDVSSSATPLNFLDAVIDSMKIDGVWHIPANNDPPGNRQILPPMSGTYVVNQAGGADYLSLGAAVADLNMRGVNGAVVIDLVPGIYQEKITLEEVSGASAVNTITIKSTTNDSTAVTIQDSAANWNENWVIRFNNASHYVLQHLHIKTLDPQRGRGIVLTGLNQHIHILNNYFEGDPMVSWGNDDHSLIYSTHEHRHLVISNNRFTNGAYGICLYGWYQESESPVISFNRIEEPFSYGILAEWQRNTVIHGNYIESPATGSSFTGISGWYFSDTFRITGNEVHIHTHGRGLSLHDFYGISSNPGLIANNMISATAQTTSFQHGIQTNWMSNTLVVFNSINLYGSTAPNSTAINLETTNNNNLGVFNNILSNQRSGYSISIANRVGISSDHNCFYTTGNNMGRLEGLDMVDLATWQMNSLKDSSSLFLNPHYFSNTNLHIINPQLKGQGIPIPGVLVDFDGDLRDPVTPDIGADEFTLPLQEASLVAILSPTGGCDLGLEDVTLRIANNGTDPITGQLTASYVVSGGVPVAESVTATIGVGDTLDFTFATKADLSVVGEDSVFTILGYIDLVGDPLQANDTALIEVWSGFQPPPPVATTSTVNYGNSATLLASGPGAKVWYATLTDTLEIGTGDTLVTPPLYDTTTFYVAASNAVFNPYAPGAFVITEMCHWRSSSTGNPAAGWPSYLVADDYIEISGIPSSDLGGITLEQYSTTSLLSTHTFPPGTLLSGDGTAIIAVGQLQGSSPDPSNFYYHGNGSYTGSFSSGTSAGRVLRAPDGTIIDAAGYGNYHFPALANVPASEWSNPITSGATSTAGVRLVGPDMNSGTNWIVSSNANRQDPNIYNTGVPLPVVVSQGECFSARVPAVANVVAFPAVDAGITQVIQPATSVMAGAAEDVIVNLHNFGTSTLTHVTIQWSLNNTMQTAYSWTGSLAQGSSVPVTIASTTLTPGEHCFKVWTHNPNGVPDNFNQNDTAESCVTACLSGTFTLGPASAGSFDFNTFNQAMNALVSGGVCGQVTINVHPSTYTEQVTFPAIPGASSAHHVVFQGASGDSTQVVLQHASTSSAQNWVVLFDKASHISFKHMTIQATGTSWGRVVCFSDTTSHITIEHCVINTNTTSTSSSFAGFFSDATPPSNHITIKNNVINGGYYGVYHEGNFNNVKTGLTIKGNHLTNFFFYGILTNFVNDLHIEGNTLVNRPNSGTLYPVYVGNSSTSGIITGNRITSQHTGTYYGIYALGLEGTSGSPWLITNNMISQEGNETGTVYGIYSQNNQHMGIYHNSVSLHGGSALNGRALMQTSGSNTRVMNNIFANYNGGYAAYYNSTWALTGLDFNNYYGVGANLILYGIQHSSLSDMQSYSGMDMNSWSLNPPFTGVHELSLTNTLLSGRATPLAEVTTDFFGTMRTATPTIGAHEIPMLQHDAGVYAILSPDGNMLVYEDDTVSVEVVVMNYGLDTLYSIPVSYTINHGTPVNAVYNGMIPSLGTDTMILPSYITSAGHVLLCAYTSLTGDTNYFNDTACIVQFAMSNIDAAVTMIEPMEDGCNLGDDTVTIHIANVSTSVIPAGFTASYRVHPTGVVVSETVPTSIVPGDTLSYTFTALADLSTTVDTTWLFTAWVTVTDDHNPGNDTMTMEIISLAAPPPPAVVSPVSTPFGTSILLDANTPFYTEWFASETDTIAIATGNQFQTPLLYDTVVYWVQSLPGPSQSGFGSYPELLYYQFDIPGTSVDNLATQPVGDNPATITGNGLSIGGEGLSGSALVGTGVNSTNGVINTGWNTNLNGSFTIAFWTSDIHPSSTLYYIWGDGGANNWRCFTNGVAGAGNWMVRGGGLPDLAINGAATMAPNMVHVVYDASAGSYSSYVDGVLNTTVSTFTSHVISGSGFQIGGLASHSNLHGKMDEFRIYNRALSQAEILETIHGPLGSEICASERVPLVVHVTNIPPLGVPSVSPESLEVVLTGCQDTETKGLRIRNIGTDVLQYTTFGGPHVVDTTSTQYYSSTVYPDTTDHIFTTLPQSLDSLYLEITINGTYANVAARATLIIEGTNMGFIPDGGVPNGTDITVLYAFGGLQLQNWLDNGELHIRIGNSASVTPWTGTRMHRIRAFTEPVPWVSMSQGIGGIAVGDSITIPVHFSAAGLEEGVYHTTIPLEFNHPGYPFVKVPVTMSVTGEPVIASDPCLQFQAVFQYDQIADSMLIQNTGCVELVIHDISVSDSVFTPLITQATVPAFGSLWLPVSFSSTQPGSFTDTLVVWSNTDPYSICLQASALGPPAILVSHDTVEVHLTGCNDTLVFPFQINNIGDASLDWHIQLGGQVSIGDGAQSSALAGPTYISGAASSYWHSNHISLFTPAELDHSGSIASLAWRKADFHGYLHDNATFRIYLKHTNLQSVPSTMGTFASELSGATLVYENLNQGLPTDTGWYSFDFNTVQSFLYNGNQNLMVLVEWYRPNHATGAVGWYITPQTGKAHTWSGNSSSPTISYGVGQRPDISVSFAGVIDYLSVHPDSGSVAPQSAQTIQLVFDAAGIVSGTLAQDFDIHSNDPLHPKKSIHAIMQLTGQPELHIPLVGCFLFDTTLQGGIQTKEITLHNIGCETLLMQSYATSTQHFNITGNVPSIAPFDSAVITLAFNPQTTGWLSDTLVITTNAGLHTICLEGYAAPAPDIAFSTKSLHGTIQECDDSLWIPLQILNQGSGTLYFTLHDLEGSTSWMSIDSAGLGTSYYLPHQGHYLPGPNIGPQAVVTASSCNPSCNAFNNGNTGVCGTQQVWVSTGSPPPTNPHVNYIDFTWPDSVTIDGLTIHNAFSGSRLLNGATLFFWDGNGWVEFYTFANLPAQCENVVPFPPVSTTRLRITAFSMHQGGQINNPAFREIEVHQAVGAIEVAPAGFINVNIKLNALNLNNGQYTSALLVSSNDPLNPVDTISVQMDVIGDPELRFSTLAPCLDFDTIIQGFTAQQTVWIYNDGCDTLHIPLISNALPQYILSENQLTLLPDDSAALHISFVPDGAAHFTDSVHFSTNIGVYTICLSGVGIDAPVISVATASLSHTFSNCHDSVVKTFTIYNSGIGNLIYSLSNLLGGHDHYTSTQHYTTHGGSTQHHFSGITSHSDSMRVIVTQNGDYNTASKFSHLYINGESIGAIQNSSPPNGTDIVTHFVFGGTQLENWLSTGHLEVVVQNTSSVSHSNSLQNLHKVDLILYGTPWLTANPVADTVVSGDSSVVQLLFSTAGLPNGTYYTDLRIASNDPVNQVLHLPCSMNLNGSPAIAFDAPCLHFGQIMQYASLKDTLVITNTGCAPLVISSLYTTQAAFGLSTSYILLQPGQQHKLVVNFNPTQVGQVTDNIHLITNVGSYTVCLSGEGIDASILDVNPYSFSKVITQCNDTLSDVLQVLNLGTGDLNYQVFGGRGLSGDSSILLIRNGLVGNVNVPQYIQLYFGITPHTITASEIAATQFELYDIIITVGGQDAAYYNQISNEVSRFTTFVDQGGILLYMLGDAYVSSVSLPGGAQLVYGSSEMQNIIEAPGHPLLTGLSNPLLGSNANTGYFINLPSQANVISRTNLSSHPTTIEYEIGSGLVIATSMPWEVHSAMPQFNISAMLDNALLYTLSNVGASPSWLSFDFTPATVYGIDTALITVQFNSTGIPNGVYHSNIIVYSNDPVNPQMLIPCTLSVSGAAELFTQSHCIQYDTVVEGATVTRYFSIHNPGCDDLFISNITSQSGEYTPSTTSGTVPPGDSLVVAVHFTPLDTGLRFSMLEVFTNVGNAQVCVEGLSINPPVISVQPTHFDITLHHCQDTTTQDLILTNTGLGQAVYHILGLYGSDIDQTSTTPFNISGAATTHTFTNLPPNIDTLILEITVSGDFDDAHEYAELIIEGVLIGQVDDGNTTAGVPVTDYFGFGGSQLSGWVSNGQLEVILQNSPTVDHWAGLNSFHSVRLLVNGNYWIHPTSTTDTIPVNSTAQVPLHFLSTHMPVGVHHYTLLVASNDPGNAQVTVPCTLTVFGDAQWTFDKACLQFDSTLIGLSNEQLLTISNTGCDTLVITSVTSDVPSMVPALQSAVVLPYQSLQLPVTFTPLVAGVDSGSLVVTSHLGQQVICLTGNGLNAPSISVSKTSLSANLVCQVTETLSVTVTNTGLAPLHYQLTPAGAPFVTTTQGTGIVMPSDSASIYFHFNKAGFSTGMLTANLLLTHNDPITPPVDIACTLDIPYILSPVDLGADVMVCDNQQVVLDAGSGYATYLWDDATTGVTRQVFVDGSYHITVTDTNNCHFTDTIQVTFFPAPLVDAGPDTVICSGLGLERHAQASGMVNTQKSVQIGFNTQFSTAQSASVFLTSNNAAKRQILYRQSEMELNGFKRGWIESIEIHIGAVGSPSTLNQFELSIGSTQVNNLAGGYLPNLTTVYSAPSHALQPGWHTITFDAPYFYNGADNIVIQICFSNPSRDFSSSVQFHQAPFAGASRFVTSNQHPFDICTQASGTLTNQRPNIRFNGQVDEATYSWIGPGGFTANTPVLRIPTLGSQHNGLFQLHVDNGIGCVGTDHFLLVLSPLPVVNTGGDHTILEGGSVLLAATVTGGQAPYTYLWSHGSTLSDYTALQPLASPTETTTYTLTATGSNGCQSTGQSTVTVVPTYTISGSLTYNNAAFTPLNASTVYLMDDQHQLIDSTITNVAGGFAFAHQPPGTYSLHASTSKPWGGVNATDALVVQRHVINLNPLSGLRYIAADVNHSETITSVDALLILRRALGMDTVFARGDWVFEQPTVQVTHSNVIKDFQGLAIGDVNGSYLPAILRQIPIVEVHPKGWIPADRQQMEVPLTAAEHLNMGAMTLFFDLPDGGIAIEGVSSPLPGLMYHVDRGRLKIVWSDEQGFVFHPGDHVLRIQLSSESNATAPFWLQPTLSSEIADVNALVLEPVVLHAPSTAAEHTATTRELTVYNQPNPFTDITQIVCHVPADGEILIEVFDMLGKRIAVVERGQVVEGEHRYDFRSGALPAGVYHYRITLETEQQIYSLNQSMVIVK